MAKNEVIEDIVSRFESVEDGRIMSEDEEDEGKVIIRYVQKVCNICKEKYVDNEGYDSDAEGVKYVMADDATMEKVKSKKKQKELEKAKQKEAKKAEKSGKGKRGSESNLNDDEVCADHRKKEQVVKAKLTKQQSDAIEESLKEQVKTRDKQNMVLVQSAGHVQVKRAKKGRSQESRDDPEQDGSREEGGHVEATDGNVYNSAKRSEGDGREDVEQKGEEDSRDRNRDTKEGERSRKGHDNDDGDKDEHVSRQNEEEYKRHKRNKSETKSYDSTEDQEGHHTKGYSRTSREDADHDANKDEDTGESKRYVARNGDENRDRKDSQDSGIRKRNDNDDDNNDDNRDRPSRQGSERRKRNDNDSDDVSKEEGEIYKTRKTDQSDDDDNDHDSKSSKRDKTDKIKKSDDNEDDDEDKEGDRESISSRQKSTGRSDDDEDNSTESKTKHKDNEEGEHRRTGSRGTAVYAHGRRDDSNDDKDNDGDGKERSESEKHSESDQIQRVEQSQVSAAKGRETSGNDEGTGGASGSRERGGDDSIVNQETTVDDGLEGIESGKTGKMVTRYIYHSIDESHYTGNSIAEEDKHDPHALSKFLSNSSLFHQFCLFLYPAEFYPHINFATRTITDPGIVGNFIKFFVLFSHVLLPFWFDNGNFYKVHIIYKFCVTCHKKYRQTYFQSDQMQILCVHFVVFI